jgi:hypothetical protein
MAAPYGHGDGRARAGRARSIIPWAMTSSSKTSPLAIERLFWRLPTSETPAVSGADEPQEQVGDLAIEIGTSVQEEASVSLASGQVADAP